MERWSHSNRVGFAPGDARPKAAGSACAAKRPRLPAFLSACATHGSPRLRTDQCCSVTEVSARLSVVLRYGTKSTALFTA